MKKKIYKIDNNIIPIEASSIELVNNAGFQLINIPCGTSDEIIKKCHDASALIVGSESIGREVIEGLPSLEAVARCGVGVDKVDLKAATNRGVQITNVPDANLEEVATHTIALVLALTRRLFAFDESTRKGKWGGNVATVPLRRPCEQVLGIVGGGRIGLRVVEMARAIGFQVLVNTLEMNDQKRVREAGASAVTFDELIERSDIVSLHIPLTESTRGILSHSVMAKMKKGSYLVNVSRGGLVDEQALLSNLDSGHLAAAALDVFVTEPLPAESPMCNNGKVILSPHIAYLSEDSNREVSRKAVEQVISVLQGQRPAYPVN